MIIEDANGHVADSPFLPQASFGDHQVITTDAMNGTVTDTDHFHIEPSPQALANFGMSGGGIHISVTNWRVGSPLFRSLGVDF